MTISFVLIVFGAGLIYCGWKGVSFQHFVFGDNTVIQTTGHGQEGARK